MERVGRKKLPTRYIPVEGNVITIKAAHYTPEHTQNPRDLTILMPGWSVNGSALALTHMAKSFARASSNPVLALSSDFRTPTSKTPQQQIEAIDQYLAGREVNTVTLVAHSQRDSDALLLARHYEQKRARGEDAPIVEQVVLMNPISLAGDPRRIPSEIAKAAFIHIPLDTIKGIARGEGGLERFTEAALVGLNMAKHIGAQMVRRRLGYFKYVQQQLANMTQPLPQDIQAPITVVLGEHDNVIAVDNAAEKARTMLPTARVIRHSRFSHHGMPYQEHKVIAEKTVGRRRITT